MSLTFKDFVKIGDKTLLISEGGVAGHMSHLYDNWDLTFGAIKDVFNKASQGQLEGTEKTDGQNLFVSYSAKHKAARAARNKGDIKNGGMSIQEISNKFAGRGSIHDAFVDALSIFDKAVGTLSKQQQVKIFGPDADVYYNAEVMDPRNANIINYDKKSLVIHQVGHAMFNKQTGEVMDVNVGPRVNSLFATLKAMQDAISNEDFSIVKNATIKLGELSNKSALTRAVNELNKIESNDSMTLKDYIYGQAVKKIYEMLPKNKIDAEAAVSLAKKIMGEKGQNVLKIKKLVPPEYSSVVDHINDNAGKMLKEIIRPIESVVHDFSVEMLRSLSSAFIIDNRKELKRLRAEVDKAIRLIQSSNSESAMEVLKQQLAKLKSADNVSTTAEGFVFDYDGHSYKFTGNFAPVNQIIGLFKYGRAGLPPLNESEQQEYEDILREIHERQRF